MKTIYPHGHKYDSHGKSHPIRKITPHWYQCYKIGIKKVYAHRYIDILSYLTFFIQLFIYIFQKIFIDLSIGVSSILLRTSGLPVTISILKKPSRQSSRPKICINTIDIESGHYSESAIDNGFGKMLVISTFILHIVRKTSQNYN